MRRVVPCAAAAFALAAPLASSASAHNKPHPPSYAETVSADHPTSYWRLDERPNSLVAADQMNNHPGSYEGDPRIGVPHGVGFGPFGDRDGAIDLDGLLTRPVGQSVHVADGGHLAFPGRQAFSLEAWIKPRGLNDATRRVFSKEDANGGYLLGVRDDGIFFSRYVTGSAQTVGAPIAQLRGHDDQWIHVVATYDGTTMALYLDGQQVAQAPSTQELPVDRSDLSLGSMESRWRFYAGGLDEAAIYPYALTADQVLTHTRVGDGADG
jgi:hypothetical protein